MHVCVNYILFSCSLFHRKVHGNFTHFTDSQVSKINLALNQAQQELLTLGLSNKFNISLANYIKTVPI